MRIAIAGASGTGKTTLAKAISEKFGIPLNPVGARSVALEMGFENPYDVDAAGKRVEFQKRLFEAKRDWELAHDSFVTDRCYLDNLTYCALHMAEHLEDDAIEVFTKAMDRYHVAIMLSLSSFQDLSDGIRKQSLAYHRIYEQLLEQFIESASDAGRCFFVYAADTPNPNLRADRAVRTLEWCFGRGVFPSPGINIKP